MKKKWFVYVLFSLLAAGTDLPGSKTSLAQELSRSDLIAYDWCGTWSCSVYADKKLDNMPFEGATLRQVVRVSMPGKKVRLRFSNLFGESPLVLKKVHLAQSAGGHAIETSTDLTVTFDGNESVTMPPGSSVTSDAMDYDLPALSPIAITIYFGSVPSTLSGHVGSRTHSYYQNGDAVVAASLTSPFSKVHWYVIDRMDVYGKEDARAVVAYGDSITDGYGTTTDAQNRWPDYLATRLQGQAQTRHMGVLNAGIGATGLMGSGTGRFQRDVLDQTDVGYLLMLYGVNDILFGRQSASQVISAYQTLIQKAHEKKILVYGCTLMPFGGYSRYSDEKDAIRQQINDWIKNTPSTAGGFDGAIDFDAALRDPNNPKRLAKVYSNDWLHPSIVGYQTMADCIDLKLFASSSDETTSVISCLPNVVTETAQPGAFAVVAAGQAAPLWCDGEDHQGVLRAVGDLQKDIERVTGKTPQLSMAPSSSSVQPILIGSLDKSKMIDRLVATGKLDVVNLKGKWESFVIATVKNPMPGIDQALVIVGSDKRGTIFGIYELSQQLGVSPWYWWADVPARKRQQAYIIPGRYESGEPKVKYRGIFINDENPSFGSWSKHTFGGCNSRMYVHMFELILRLRGNYLWPAMWGKSIYEDDPESARLADEYGVVLGSTHHEPMTRAHADWQKNGKNYGNGEWNYATNEEGLKKFWTEGIERNKDYEVLVTIGMRGDGDKEMTTPDDVSVAVKLMEKIVADQRQIIADVKKVDPATVPQMWVLYKEVTNFYDHGVRLPDDVTMLWCDDNWGNLRRLPSPEERKRSGGAGIYYHYDYCGSPHNYKWLNTNPLPKIWEQMNMAYEYDAKQIWVVNVGDLKPMELPIEFFITMGWNPEELTKDKIEAFTVQWAEREFGPKYAVEIADIVSKYAKYNGWRKPESIKPGDFSLVNYGEADRIVAAWQEITAKAEAIYDKLPSEYRPAFFQLVLYPTKASATVAEYNVEHAKNSLYAAQGRVTANEYAQRMMDLYNQDKKLRSTYHSIVDGKWRSMMNTTVLWRKPEPVKVTPDPSAVLGVAIEGSKSAWPGESKAAVLPAVDSLNQQTRWIDVFRRGRENLKFSVSADKPWVKLDSFGTGDQDQRIEIGVDWDKVPVGNQSAVITVSDHKGQSVPVQLNAVKSDKYTRDTMDAFGGLTGPTAISADRFTKKIAAGEVRWEKIPDYGRGSSGMAIFPVTAESVTPPQNSPCMEYPVFIPKAGDIQIDFIIGVALKVQTNRSVSFAVSIDDQAPQIIDLFEGYSSDGKATQQPAFKNWSNWVKDNARTLNSTLKVAEPGVHTLKIWMVDPGVVLQKMIIHDGELPYSYLGPPQRD